MEVEHHQMHFLLNHNVHDDQLRLLAQRLFDSLIAALGGDWQEPHELDLPSQKLAHVAMIFDNQDFVHGSKPACFKVMDDAKPLPTMPQPLGDCQAVPRALW